MLKNKWLQGILLTLVFYGMYYALEQYELHKTIEANHEVEFVDPSILSKMTIASYPAMDAFTTREKAIVNESFQVLSKLHVKNTRKFKESSAYYKVTFAEDTNFKKITYTFYEGDYVKREEYVSGIGKTEYFTIDEPILEDLFVPMLEAEMNT